MSLAEPVKAALRRIGRSVPRDPGRRVVVLCYHSIHPSMPFRSATPALFSEHLDWLASECRCVPLSEIPAATQQRNDGRPVVSLTFDDGYADNHGFALPRLVGKGLTATFFLTTGLVDGDPSTVERFGHLQRVDEGVIQPLNWGQVEEMVWAGMEMGAHTVTHPNLARLQGAELDHEVVHAKAVIEDRLGRETRTMAYPFGRPRVHFNDTVTATVRTAGYGLACSAVTRGVRASDDRLNVPRIFVTGDSVESLRDKVLGVWDLIGTIREGTPLTLSRIMSRPDFRV